MQVSRNLFAASVTAMAVLGLASVAGAASVDFTYISSGTTYTATLNTPTAATNYGYTAIGGSVANGFASNPNYNFKPAGKELSIGEVAARFAAAVGESLTFTRLYDTGPVAALNANISGAISATANNLVDSQWRDGTVNIAVRAGYSANSQYIGTAKVGDSITNPTIASVYQLKAGVNVLGAPAPGTGSLDTGGSPFIFVRSSSSFTVGQSIGTDKSNSKTSTFQRTDGTTDRFVSFEVKGATFSGYAVFTEDFTDYDYNDAAFLFEGVARAVTPAVPLPSAALMGGAAFGLLGVRRARRALQA